MRTKVLWSCCDKDFLFLIKKECELTFENICISNKAYRQKFQAEVLCCFWKPVKEQAASLPPLSSCWSSQLSDWGLWVLLSWVKVIYCKLLRASCWDSWQLCSVFNEKVWGSNLQKFMSTTPTSFWFIKILHVVQVRRCGRLLFSAGHQISHTVHLDHEALHKLCFHES